MKGALHLSLLLTLSTSILLAQTRIPSPDGKLYAVAEQGQATGKGKEVERFSVFNASDELVSVLHIWLEEPDGTMRVSHRGCESSGWLDSARFYCEGSGDPDMGIYRWFDARSGKELGEAIGSDFTWSPDFTALANFGNVPHFADEDSKSDSIDVGSHSWPPEPPPIFEQHWFRSSLVWSPDSRLVAVVDHQRYRNKAFFLVIVDRSNSKVTEQKLSLPDETDEWPPEHDFDIKWGAGKVTVDRGGFSQTIRR